MIVCIKYHISLIFFTPSSSGWRLSCRVGSQTQLNWQCSSRAPSGQPSTARCQGYAQNEEWDGGLAAWTASTWLQLLSWNGEPPMPAMRLRALVLWALCVSEVRFLSVPGWRDMKGNGIMAEIGSLWLMLLSTYQALSNHIRHGTVSVFLHSVNARPWDTTHRN